MKENILKILQIITILVILQMIYLKLSLSIPTVNKVLTIDTCLDKGYCWDYIRNKCEQNDQGFCFKNKQDCNNRNGHWEEDIQYCKL